MQNLVGNKIPSAKEIDDLVAEVKTIQDKIDHYTILLDKDARLATTKFRKGGEQVVATVADLADEHGVVLPKISTDDMKADLLLSQRLRPLARAVEALHQRLDDTVLEAQSECWWAATAFYTALSRLVSADPAIEGALAPVIDFFAIGRRTSKKSPAEPKPGNG